MCKWARSPSRPFSVLYCRILGPLPPLFQSPYHLSTLVPDSTQSLAEAELASALSLVSMARCSRRLVADVGINLFVNWRVFLVATGVSVRDARMVIFKNIVEAGGDWLIALKLKGSLTCWRWSFSQKSLSQRLCRGPRGVSGVWHSQIHTVQFRTKSGFIDAVCAVCPIIAVSAVSAVSDCEKIQ